MSIVACWDSLHKKKDFKPGKRLVSVDMSLLAAALRKVGDEVGVRAAVLKPVLENALAFVANGCCMVILQNYTAAPAELAAFADAVRAIEPNGQLRLAAAFLSARSQAMAVDNGRGGGGGGDDDDDDDDDRDGEDVAAEDDEFDADNESAVDNVADHIKESEEGSGAAKSAVDELQFIESVIGTVSPHDAHTLSLTVFSGVGGDGDKDVIAQTIHRALETLSLGAGGLDSLYFLNIGDGFVGKQCSHLSATECAWVSERIGAYETSDAFVLLCRGASTEELCRPLAKSLLTRFGGGAKVNVNERPMLRDSEVSEYLYALGNKDRLRLAWTFRAADIDSKEQVAAFDSPKALIDGIVSKISANKGWEDAKVRERFEIPSLSVAKRLLADCEWCSEPMKPRTHFVIGKLGKAQELVSASEKIVSRAVRVVNPKADWPLLKRLPRTRHIKLVDLREAKLPPEFTVNCPVMLMLLKRVSASYGAVVVPAALAVPGRISLMAFRLISLFLRLIWVPAEQLNAKGSPWVAKLGDAGASRLIVWRVLDAHQKFYRQAKKSSHHNNFGDAWPKN